MRLRFIAGEVFSGLRRNGTMALSVVLVTFVSLTFVGAAALTQVQVDKLKDDWYDKVEVSVFLCPESSPSIQCASGRATPAQEEAIRAVLVEGAAAPLVDEVTSIGAEIGATPAQTAIAWILTRGTDIAPIPGTRRVARMEENTAADAIELTQDQVDRLTALEPAAGARHDEVNMGSIDS